MRPSGAGSASSSLTRVRAPCSADRLHRVRHGVDRDELLALLAEPEDVKRMSLAPLERLSEGHVREPLVEARVPKVLHRVLQRVLDLGIERLRRLGAEALLHELPVHGVVDMAGEVEVCRAKRPWPSS